MIKLDVHDYCHECPYFDAVMVAGYVNKSIGGGVVDMIPSGDTLVKCKSWHVCGRAVTTALTLKEEKK